LAAQGILYLVATPIGNLADVSFRAIETLKQADWIACEDTRHSLPLLHHYGIDRPLLTLHEHNETACLDSMLGRLQAGEAIALISDAGTPLINDPGFPLVRAAIAAGIRVIPIPGPCALMTALSASGLPTHRFSFEGFPPRKSTARVSLLASLKNETRTLIFYESSHRVRDFLGDLAGIFPGERPVVIARELTKRFETLARTTVGEAPALVDSNPDMQKGEFVIVVAGQPEGGPDETRTREMQRILGLLLAECSLKSAVHLTVQITGAGRDEVYREALRLKAVNGSSGNGQRP